MAAHYKIEADGSVTIMMNIKPGSILDQEEQIVQAVAEKWGGWPRSFFAGF